MPLALTPWRLRQTDFKFKVRLAYIIKSCLRKQANKQPINY
jgi:hypothetical protein